MLEHLGCARHLNFFLRDPLLLVTVASNDDDSALVSNASSISALGVVATSTVVPSDITIIGDASASNYPSTTSVFKDPNTSVLSNSASE